MKYTKVRLKKMFNCDEIVCYIYDDSENSNLTESIFRARKNNNNIALTQLSDYIIGDGRVLIKSRYDLELLLDGVL